MYCQRFGCLADIPEPKDSYCLLLLVRFFWEDLRASVVRGFRGHRRRDNCRISQIVPLLYAVQLNLRLKWWAWRTQPLQQYAMAMGYFEGFESTAPSEVVAHWLSACSTKQIWVYRVTFKCCIGAIKHITTNNKSIPIIATYHHRSLWNHHDKIAVKQQRTYNNTASSRLYKYFVSRAATNDWRLVLFAVLGGQMPRYRRRNLGQHAPDH